MVDAYYQLINSCFAIVTVVVINLVPSSINKELVNTPTINYLSIYCNICQVRSFVVRECFLRVHIMPNTVRLFSMKVACCIQIYSLSRFSLLIAN